MPLLLSPTSRVRGADSILASMIGPNPSTSSVHGCDEDELTGETPGFFLEERQHGTSCVFVLGDATCGLQIAQDFRSLHRTTRVSPAKIARLMREALPGWVWKMFEGVAARLGDANAKRQSASAVSWSGKKVQTGGGCAATHSKTFQEAPAAPLGPHKNAQTRGGRCGSPYLWTQKRGGCSARPGQKTNKGGWLRSPLWIGNSKPMAAALPARFCRISALVAARAECFWGTGESLDVVTSSTAASKRCCGRLIGRPK